MNFETSEPVTCCWGVVIVVVIIPIVRCIRKWGVFGQPHHSQVPAGATRWQAAGGAPHDSEARRGAKDGDILPGWLDRSMENAGNRMELVVIGLVVPGVANSAGIQRVFSEFCKGQLGVDVMDSKVMAERKAAVSGKLMVLFSVRAEAGQAVMDRKCLLDGSCGVSIDLPRTREALQKRHALRQLKPRPQAEEEVPVTAQPVAPSPRPDAAPLPPTVRREKRTTLPQEDQASRAQQRVSTSPAATCPIEAKQADWLATPAARPKAKSGTKQPGVGGRHRRRWHRCRCHHFCLRRGRVRRLLLPPPPWWRSDV